MKFNSYGFWTALSGAIVVLLEALGKCFGFSIDNELVSGVIMAFAGLLVVLGVVSMPSDANKGSSEKDEDFDEENKDENDEINDKNKDE